MVKRLISKIFLLSLSLAVLSYLFIVFLAFVPVPKPRINIGKIPPGDRGHTLQRFREIEKYNDIDVLCIGSSTCYRGFDPRIFENYGLSCFNMGSINQTPLNTYYLLLHYIDKLHPVYILFDISVGTMNNTDGLEGFADLVVNLPYSPELLQMGLATGNIYAVNTMIKEYTVERLATPYKNKKQNDIEYEKYISGGYVETDCTQTRDLNNLSQFEVAMAEEQTGYLEKIFKLINEKGCEMVVLIQPMPAELKSKMTGCSEIAKQVECLVEKYGLRFINYNEILTFDSREDYFDAFHLNSQGVKKYNTVLINDIFVNKTYEK